MTKRKVSVMECDAPFCFVQRVIEPNEVPPEGIYLDRGSFHNSSGGGPITKVYACSLEHVEAAVEHAMYPGRDWA